MNSIHRSERGRMDKWTEIQIFVESVRRGSFSAAGRQLDLSPSAVSKAMSRLESRLGVRLLNRSTRKLSLTEAGSVFYSHSLAMLTAMESAEDSLAGFGSVPAGTLRISSTPGFANLQLLPLLPDFQLRYPRIKVDLRLTGEVVDLVREGIDVAIRLGALSDTSLVGRKLGESRRIVCASPDYLHRKGYPRNPKDLDIHNCLRLSTSESFNQWQFGSSRGIEVVDVRGNFVTDSVSALRDYALMGGGVVRLSAFMVRQDIAFGRLVPLLADYETTPQQIHAVYAHRKLVPAKLKVFLDFLVSRFSPAPPWD
ncbi:MAG: LysR family transcriptional regulator [Rhodocyclaceae bacterium]|nr:MAG: LysR family transcriptional regulator [Rhodocyclaceae bacterium]